MTRVEAKQLATRIELEAPHCHVTGLLHWAGTNAYEVTVHDSIEGGTFIVRSVEDWEERVNSA